MKKQCVRSVGRKQAGLTIPELVAGLVIIGVVLANTIPRITQLFTGEELSRLKDDVITLGSAARNWKGVKTSYTGVDCQTLINDKHAVRTWDQCSSANPDNGSYEVSANSDPAMVDVTANTLEESLCARAANDLDGAAEATSCSGGTLTVTFDR